MLFLYCFHFYIFFLSCRQKSLPLSTRKEFFEQAAKEYGKNVEDNGDLEEE
jgi:hypothetical protein